MQSPLLHIPEVRTSVDGARSLAWFGGSNAAFRLCATGLRPEATPASLLADLKPASLNPRKRDGPIFQRGWLGFVPYRARMQAMDLGRWYRVEQAWIEDPRGVYRCGDQPLTRVDTSKRPESITRDIKFDGFTLSPRTSAEHYIALATAAITAIQQGDYYQINLLRYFDAAPVASADASMTDIVQWALTRGGSHAAVLFDGGLEILSLSPERFLSGHQGSSNHYSLNTYPIKGTMAIINGNAEEAVSTLRASSKDRAELNMIIDLMRHDLYPLAQKGTIAVVKAEGILQTTELVHQFGHVSARAHHDLSLLDILHHVCPAGSITGAPKQAVMAAIATAEARERGYVMGHVFIYDEETGYLDSSVMIRTLCKAGAATGYEYAAGSGLVVKSDPYRELAEIALKCQVVGPVSGTCLTPS